LLERAAEVASGAGEHDLAIGYVNAAADEMEHTAAAPVGLGLLCAQKCLYMWRAGSTRVVAVQPAVNVPSCNN
jgi:hypothetical protein